MNDRSPPGRQTRQCEPDSPALSTLPPTSAFGWSSTLGTVGGKLVTKHQLITFILYSFYAVNEHTAYGVCKTGKIIPM